MAESEKTYKVVPFPTEPWDRRWCIVDAETGEILDDAQGYGYKSVQKAHAAWNYKNRTPAQKQVTTSKKKLVRDWCREHPDALDDLEYEELCALKEGRKFGAREVRELFEASGLEMPCDAASFARYWGEYAN